MFALRCNMNHWSPSPRSCYLTALNLQYFNCTLIPSFTPNNDTGCELCHTESYNSFNCK